MKKIVYKITGEAFKNEEKLNNVINDVMLLNKLKVKTVLVTGGGNFFRGRNKPDNMKSSIADEIGMLGTVQNALTLYDKLNKKGLKVRIVLASSIKRIALRFSLEFRDIIMKYTTINPDLINIINELNIDEYDAYDCDKYLSDGYIVINGGGTGRIKVSTDTTCATIARELEEVDAILFSKNIDGIYTSDPKKDSNAKLISYMTHKELLDLVCNQDLSIIDGTSAYIMYEDKINAYFYSADDINAIEKIINGEQIGTVVK